MSHPKPIPTIRRERAPAVAAWLIALFCGATALALMLSPSTRNLLLDLLFDWPAQ